MTTHQRPKQRDTDQYVAELLSSAKPPLLVDVRAPRERDQKHVVGSLGIPLNHLAENLEKLPKDRALLVYCAGGIADWEAAKLPVQTAQNSS